MAAKPQAKRLGSRLARHRFGPNRAWISGEQVENRSISYQLINRTVSFVPILQHRGKKQSERGRKGAFCVARRCGLDMVPMRIAETPCFVLA